jgi:hypothetical protein
MVVPSEYCIVQGETPVSVTDILTGIPAQTVPEPLILAVGTGSTRIIAVPVPVLVVQFKSLTETIE